MLDDLPGETSSITFPDESPTRSDFQYWRDRLRAITSASHTLGQALGPYIAKSHVHNRWFVADDEGELFYRFEDNGENMHSVFAKEQAAYDTRFGRRYKLCENREGNPPMQMHASIREVNASTVTLHSTLAAFQPPPPITGFWETLQSYPNQTLWKYFHCDGDGSWIYNGMLLGSLIIGHDGSCMPEVTKDVCSTGFAIFCTKTGHLCKGAAAEQTKHADNYRGEALGGLLVQLVLRAASQLGTSPFKPVRINCDNIGVVNHGNTPRRPMKEKQAQADILRCIKHQVATNSFHSTFHWVALHQDKKKKWHELTIRGKINVIVDRLAKLVLVTCVDDNEFIDSEFSFEQIRVKV